MPENKPPSAPHSLRIVHCFRSPVGGIFRHVRDLIEAQAAAGHQVGILCDSNTGGAYEEELFESLAGLISLGQHRIPMQRKIGPSDVIALWRCYRQIKELKPDILHSHGAKGGAYARIIGSALRLGGSKVARLYCPHGGSIHFDKSSWRGKVYFMLERILEKSTDRLIFVSEYERRGYIEKVGPPKCPTSLIYNGLREEEFEPVKPLPDAADFLFIGMMRNLKGPDLFIAALPIVEKLIGRKITAHMVGDGPDLASYVQAVEKSGMTERVTFHMPMQARQAFSMAKVVVIPSRAESMPYIILEALAAARPLVTTNVGGIPEIYGDNSSRLVKPGDPEALGQAMLQRLENPKADEEAAEMARQIHGRFSVSTMAAAINSAYQATLFPEFN